MTKDYRILGRVIYLSPAGSTRLIAQAIHGALIEAGAASSLVDLGCEGDTGLRSIPGPSQDRVLLFVGSPVYADRALPPVLDYINRMPEAGTVSAVPFVTWGGVCSGLALWQLGAALQSRGCRLVGGMKILARHSMMWDSDHALAENHPDESDLQMVSSYVKDLISRCLSGAVEELVLGQLDTHPVQRSTRMRARLDRSWPVTEKRIDQKRCTRCGKCVESCPVAAIEMIPFPVFRNHCINCFNCVRLCPEDAILTELDRERLITRLKRRADEIEERPVSEAFRAQLGC
ncbi:MAG: EFR1 family ferrodoxin [Anaerolineales bacterium]|nr:EFR1 family ferrodoxin [Anaerolineales bacterium]